MIITLIDERLSFVARPRSVVHVSSHSGTHTLCGVAIDETMAHRDNRLSTDGRLCRRCYRSLRTYGPQFVQVEQEKHETQK